jgi:glycosyltransferase 2 family protein
MTRLRFAASGRLWLAILGICISIAALWIAVRNVDLAFVAQRLATSDVRYLAIALAAGSIQVWLRTIRWQLLLPVRSDGTRVQTRRLVPVLLIGYLGNVVLPARLGEVVRTYLVSRRESLDPISVLGTVVLERILDLVALAGFAMIIAIAIGAPAWIVAAAGVAAALGAVALLVAVVGLPTIVGSLSRRADPAGTRPSWLNFPGSGGVLRIANRFSGGVGGSHRRGTVAIAAVLSLLAWPIDALLVWLVAKSISIDIPLATAALISAAAVLSTAVPSAPGYVGTYELAAASAAQAMGVDGSPAFALAVLAHALTILPAAIAGAICLVVLRGSLGRILPPQSEAASPEP